jgi:hypothetical protein
VVAVILIGVRFVPLVVFAILPAFLDKTNQWHRHVHPKRCSPAVSSGAHRSSMSASVDGSFSSGVRALPVPTWNRGLTALSLTAFTEREMFTLTGTLLRT